MRKESALPLPHRNSFLNLCGREPIETSVGFILFFFDHCFTSNGSNVAKSLIPAITLAPEHIGHFSPLERALTLACHS